MSTGNPFTDLIERIRAGDAEAAAELVRQNEPLIRREVRLHLEDQRLARRFDSMDVCQSVLASFFVRTAAGQYDLEQPAQLVRLLVTMVRNKLASAARRENRQRRDQRRTTDGEAELANVKDKSPEPGDVLADRELLERFRGQLSDEERQLVDLRAEGLGWAEIAVRLGGSPQARRMQLSRAVQRSVRTLGLDDWEV